MDIVKEIIIILLSATLALNFANIEESNKTHKKVIKLLETTHCDINSQYMHNNVLLDEYNNEFIDAKILKANTMHNTALIETILDNDTVIATVSPLMFSVLTSELRNLNSFYDFLTNAEDNKNIITMALSVKSHNETILWALDTEIKHLQKLYSEKELESLYQEYIDNKYQKIEIN